MGVKGSRKKNNSPTKYQEPDLLVGVDDILKSAQEKGLYTGKSVNIEDVVNSFEDIQVVYESMDANQSGSLSNIDGKWIVCINKNHNNKRQRFTLAHELGHYILHKEKSVEFVDTTFFRSDEMDSIEYHANEFAARLLMPENTVRNLIEEERIKNIGVLAEQFGVSSAAMKYRVLSLGYKMKDNG